MKIRVTNSTCQIMLGTTLLNNVRQSKKSPTLVGLLRTVINYLPLIAYCIRVMPVSVPVLKVPALTRLPWPW
jgi:hypothetical protein